MWLRRNGWCKKTRMMDWNVQLAISTRCPTVTVLADENSVRITAVYCILHSAAEHYDRRRQQNGTNVDCVLRKRFLLSTAHNRRTITHFILEDGTTDAKWRELIVRVFFLGSRDVWRHCRGEVRLFFLRRQPQSRQNVERQRQRRSLLGRKPKKLREQDQRTKTNTSQHNQNHKETLRLQWLTLHSTLTVVGWAI